MEKTKARKAARGVVARLTPSQRAQKSSRIISALGSLPELKDAAVVMAFASLSDEAQLEPLWRRLLQDGKQLLFPVLVGDEGRMDTHPVVDLATDLKPGRFGIHEPENNAPVDPRTIDFIFVPALCFDSTGHRLGRGGGYYDRFLSVRAPAAFRCGVAFECQVLDHVPVKDHDCLVNALVTENRTRRFNLTPELLQNQPPMFDK